MRVLRPFLFVLLASTTLASGCPFKVPRIEPRPAASAPGTDVYLYRFGRFLSPSGVFNITNRTGYDNQPAWDGNAKILYTSQSDGQTDIAEIDVITGSHRAVTRTPESEYSPAVSPDGKSITVVRVERDSTQRLWRFPRDGSAPSVILPDIKPVGYFAWLDSTTLALFVLGSPNALQIADTRTGRGTAVTTSIGRSLQRVPGGRRASYLHHAGNQWVLETVDPTPLTNGSFDIDTVAVMPDSADFVVWRSASEVYTAAGSRILRLRLPGSQWEQVDDLSMLVVLSISRLALSPEGGRLALVAEDSLPQR